LRGAVAFAYGSRVAAGEGSAASEEEGETLKKVVAAAAALVAALTLVGGAFAFDCIRVSSSLQGLQQSTKSGNWLLIRLDSAQGVHDVAFDLTEGQIDLSASQAACAAAAYAATGEPLYFALGTGPAGGKKTSVTPNGARSAAQGWGVIAWNAPDAVVSNGTGIDHADDTVIPALENAVIGCSGA
jgi:hypothetical protein